MRDAYILENLDGNVLIIEISRRDKKNSLTLGMYAALSAAFARATDNAAIRAVMVRGQDDLFTAGNDLSDFLAAGGQADRPAEAMRFLQVISSFEKPIVAAVAGNAIGIGTTLLFHCDLVYAADNARFQMPFVNLGLCPEGASSLVLPRLAGHVQAAELLMLCEPFNAARALELGVINAVLRPEELMDKALSQARRLAQQPSAALRITKALMKRSQNAAIKETLNTEGLQFGQLMGSAAAKEILAAFLDKRPADPLKVHGQEV